MAISKKEKIEIERNFIALLLKHKDLVLEWIDRGPDIGFFEDNHRTLLYAIMAAYNNDSLLTLKGLRSFLDNKGESKIDKLAHEKEFNLANMLYVNLDDFHVYRTRLTEAYVHGIAIDSIEEFRKNISSQGILFAVKQLESRVSDLILNTSVEKKVIYESVIDYMPEFRELLVERSKGTGDIITCGIKEIDHAMVGGFAPGTLTLFCADIGGYKSTVMLNIGLNIWKKGHNVLLVPLEMPKDKMTEKLLSRETGIPFAKFEHTQDFTEEDWKKLSDFEQERKEWPHKFFIMDAPERVPVALIRHEVEKHIDIFKPRVVIVDYVANLVPEERYKNERNDLQIGEMLKDLRHMGRRGTISNEGFSVVSAAQIGREGLRRLRKSGTGKTSFYSEDLRGSHEYSMNADHIFGQMEDPTDPTSNLILLAIKSRYGSKTFQDGKTKTVLDLKPEISLIQSKDSAWMHSEHAQEDILKKVDTPDEEWDVDIGTDIGGDIKW